MPRSKKKREREVRPLSAAGIISFYEELDTGIKMRPHFVIALAVALTAIVIVLRLLVPL